MPLTPEEVKANLERYDADTAEARKICAEFQWLLDHPEMIAPLMAKADEEMGQM